MNKKLKKMLSLITVLAISGALLVACNKGQDNSNSNQSSTGQDVNDENSYTMFMRNTYVGWIEELKWYDEAVKRTGITVDYVEGPDGFDEFYAEVDQRVISKDLPDALMTKISQTNVYGPQGVFADLAPHIKNYAPNLQKYIDENPTYKSLVENENGEIYGLIKETPVFTDFIAYRADHLEKAGIDAKAIVTTEDFTEALRTLKNKYGEDNPNYYPLTGRESAIRFAAWFGAPSSISEDASNGIYIAHYKDGSMDIKNDGAYKMVETMETWYDEGLINPEFVAGTFSEGDWEADMINGNGSFFYDYYNRAQWFMQNGGLDVDPDYQMACLDPLKDENGNVYQVTSSTKYNEELVTAVNANISEEKIKTILTFIDYFYTDEGIELANYGIEGESFEITEDGSKEFIVAYEEEEGKADGEKKWSFLNDRFTVCKPVEDEAFFKWNSDLIAEASGRIATEENILPAYNLKYSAEQSEELGNLVATVFDAQIAGITNFVTGNKEFNKDTYMKFVEEMDSLGLGRIEEIQLDAFRETYK